jgi:hypothetical protein
MRLPGLDVVFRLAAPAVDIRRAFVLASKPSMCRRNVLVGATLRK